MGFLDNAIKNGVGRAVGNAVEQGVRRAVGQRIEQAAANVVNSAANQFNTAAAAQEPVQAQGTVSQAEVAQASAALNGLFGGLSSFANEAAKNMKICPSCGEGAGKDVKFCPKCGAKLPEATLGDDAVCPSCGKQNQIGTKFCADCGAKLPAATQEEQAARTKDAAVMAQWDTLLTHYPKWNLGGKEFNIEQYDGYIMFAVKVESGFAAQNAVKQYRELLMQSGFRQAGEYPVTEHLYKMENGICYHCDTEHCFDGDQDCPTLYFDTEGPRGGFDYVKPEPKKQVGLKDLFKF